MELQDALGFALGAGAGGLFTFAGFVHRLARLEAKLEDVKEDIKDLKQATQMVAGRRHWPEHPPTGN